ncbi:hypothetical protein MLD38_039299 [Melastoma candidum]|uniref:Uncharacterized protein n=1 Tax=Melastoma candidum TaxID=119954 RepID=A0ACB9L2U4_9MYRT|nr:hypothetical protein MLD38_039299 [Melastoma candidum]
MDESSWRMCAGTGRASTTALDPDDFSDVFGGPPRSVLLRDLSSGHASSFSPLFRCRISRSLGVSPPSKLPGEAAFYEGDEYGDRKSRDRSGRGSKGMSKSISRPNSSSALSSEELSPLTHVLGDDVGVSSFVSHLRWNSSTADFLAEPQRIRGTDVLPCGRHSAVEDQFTERIYKPSNFKSPQSGFSQQAPSPETLDSESNPNHGGAEVPAEVEIEVTSPCSVVSGIQDVHMEEHDVVVASDDDDEISSSYVIKITQRTKGRARETPEIDEAIAWVKARLTHENAMIKGKDSLRRTSSWKEHAVPELKYNLRAKDQASNARGKSKYLQAATEFESLDQNMKMWTSGKEKDIRLLLSTLHRIMWADSGWEAVSLTSQTERSQVKKAYQKARLCLHPDRLQQRRTTSLQKYIAHKALTILQDSWTKYIAEGEGGSYHSS